MSEGRAASLPQAERAPRRREYEAPACRPSVVSPNWLEISDLDQVRRQIRALPSVGVAELDGDHRRLVDRFDRMIRAFGRHRDVGAFALGFHALVHRMREHFAHEERLMVELRYEGYELHRQVHKKLMSDAQRYLTSLIGRHERDQCLTVARWYAHWLLNHVSTHDRKLGEALSGDIWRIGCMGHSARPKNVEYVLAALEDALAIASLDEAVVGVRDSAFGFQGQKCSACSRAIVVEAVYDEVLEKAVEKAKQLSQGDPAEKGTFMGAVIDESAFNSIREYIETGKKEGRLMLGGEIDESEEGYFIPPTIIADVDPDATIAQEEIFGPVVAFIKARDFDHALEIANGTEYGLTGGVFSCSRERLERAKEEFHVGNLYFNRKITGALVGVQPFGGFNMSGTDSKAGGPDYLLLFTQAKAIAERHRDDVS